MKALVRLLASSATLLLACALHAADSKPIARVMTLLEVDTEDASGYAAWLKEYNDIAKAKTGSENLLRVFQTVFDGHNSGRVRVSVSASSVAELTKLTNALETDPAIVQNREHLRAIRKTGARVLYQALRFDGPSAKGANNYSALVVVTDEDAYLKALDELRGIFDSVGLKDVKMAAYRVLAGRTDHSHRVVISTASPDRLAAFLDAMGTHPRVADWLTRTAKLRTLVGSSTTREITKY
ncbi:MAG: hypothetical protein JNK23_04140 [Opitutaceae bacterium]|nr:hypothetical protein [Opitutaceae bacterium]